jgi:hypothetical protein
VVASESLTQYTPIAMRVIWWILVFLVISMLALWIVTSDLNLRDNPVASHAAIAYFLIICAGPYWMLYDCWQHEKRLTRTMWLFFLPGGFLWYYFERVRPRHHRQ